MDEGCVRVEFRAHLELLELFLAQRKVIVERIQAMLNAQRKPSQYLHDRSLLSRDFEDCFFTLDTLSDDQLRLKGQLEEAHWASGFRPRHVPELHNDLIHPPEMIRRAFHCWQQTRWPGRNGRIRYAQTLFALYILRCLELLSMRVLDAESSDAAERLSRVQIVLDALWRTSPDDQPVLLRDARWLIPLAQSPTTEELASYFEVARQVAETLTGEDRIEVQKAHVQMIGGHLRSQIRHYCIQDGVSIGEKSVVLRTRTSNALDFALLIQNLVPLLEAYEDAQNRGDDRNRLALANAICQGVSPDPEVFLLRLDLLGAYSMIEHLFIATDRDRLTADYTPMGRRHLRLLEEYKALIRRLPEALYHDCLRFRPADGAYSPYGVVYGTPTNLTEHMAFKTLQRDAASPFGMEDVFVDGDTDKLAWVNGWRKLPHIDREVQRLHEYPHELAEAIFERIEHALGKCVAGAGTNDALPESGRLCIFTENGESRGDEASRIPDLPVRFIASSDRQLVAAQKADPCDETKLLRDRQEGHFAVSYETSGGWVAIRKDMLTEVLGAGHDARIADLPPAAAETLKLMCPSLVAEQNTSSSRPPENAE